MHSQLPCLANGHATSYQPFRSARASKGQKLHCSVYLLSTHTCLSSTTETLMTGQRPVQKLHQLFLNVMVGPELSSPLHSYCCMFRHVKVCQGPHETGSAWNALQDRHLSRDGHNGRYFGRTPRKGAAPDQMLDYVYLALTVLKNIVR